MSDIASETRILTLGTQSTDKWINCSFKYFWNISGSRSI